MDWLAKTLTGLFDLLLRPFGTAGWPALAVVSALAGVLLLWLFKVTTNQTALSERRRRLTGHLYEMGLYQDHLGILMRIQWDLFKANMRYLSTSLPALLVLLPAVLVIVVQLDARYQRRGLREGETTLVSARVVEGQEDVLSRLALEAETGLDVEAGPLVDRANREVWWRVRATADTPREVTVTDGATRWAKLLAPAGDRDRLAGARERGGWHHLLLNPTEIPLPDGAPLAAIRVELPRRDDDWAGLPVWLWGFFLLSVVGGLLFKRVLKVEM
ncbi:hypothetical protein KKA85_12355 [bacterium]|nr:hypothetical protein [bacterium]MBU1676557.1 hypothetical protein [bacterium]